MKLRHRPISLAFKPEARSPTAALLGDSSAAMDLVWTVQCSTDVEIMEQSCRPTEHWLCTNAQLCVTPWLPQSFEV